MKALKLKLSPTDEQLMTLDEMFKKWASLCTRMCKKNSNGEKFIPQHDASGMWFSKTQLNQAKTDIADHKKALAAMLVQKEMLMGRIADRNQTISDMLNDDVEKDRNPNRPSNFRPKKWVVDGLLKTKFHTTTYWYGEQQKLERIKSKLENTIRKIKRGRITFKPTKVSLHSNSFLINFATSELVLKPFHNDYTITLKLVTEPEQPVLGKNGGKSSQKSADYLSDGIKRYVSYSIHSMFFGMNRAEEMLLKAKKQEKIAKRDEKLKAKKESFDEKIKRIGKLLGRELNEKELKAIKTEFNQFFNALESNHGWKPSEDYLGVLSVLSEEIIRRDDLLNLNKYPVLIRKSMNRRKKITNLKANEWKYYLQLGYEPLDNIVPSEQMTVMGIDRGLTHLLAVSVFDPSSGRFVENRLIPNPVKGWKWKIRKIKHSIQHLERRVRAQNNVHLPENQMKKRLRSIEDKVDNLYHNVSRQIINLAKERHSVIVLENLQNMKQHGRRKSGYLKRLNYALSLFDYAKIASFINYKAACEGVPVYDVLPAGTSQNCAKCLLEMGVLSEPVKLFYLEEFSENSPPPEALSNEIGFDDAKVISVTGNSIIIVGKKNNLSVTYSLEKKNMKLLVKEGENTVREYFISKEGNKSAVLGYAYVRDVSNSKVGKCTNHGQIDADLNAARVISVCYNKKINDPLPFGARKVFKFAKGSN